MVLKTNAGQIQTQQNSAASPQATQKKKALTDPLALEDRRESSHQQAALQASIMQSPVIMRQGRQMAKAFGPAIQGKGMSPVQQMKRTNGTEPLQEKPERVSENEAVPASVVQRDPGDGPLVEFIQKQGRHAATAYDLLCEQVEAGKKQVMMLEFYSGPVEDEDNAELAAAKLRIAETSAAVREHIAGLPDAVSDARATAVALARVVSIATPHELFDDWTKQSLAAIKKVAFAQAKAAGMLVRIKEEAVKMATIAMGAHEIHMMRALLKVADESDAAASDGDRVVAELNGDDSVGSSGKEKAGLAITFSDATNNAVTGIGFGVVSALDAGGVFSLSSGAATALGVIGGVLGLFFGAIGIFLGVKNTIRANQSKKKLKDAKSKVSNSELEAIAEYAIHQKEKKALRNTAAAVGGLAAIGAGVIGLIALSVATFGVAAIVAGIGAALIGLGILGYRIIHNWRKRKAERKAFADQLIAAVQGGEEDAAQARQVITGVGMDPAQAGNPGFRDNLAGKLKAYVKSKRTRMAEGLIKSLIAGKPSEVFDSELILGALGLDAEEIRAWVTADKANKAVSMVAGKLASW